MLSDSAAAILRDIRRHIDLALHFAVGLDRAAFLRDVRSVYAVVRCLEVISEASRRLPEELKARHPSIAWRQMAGAGNVYRHDYEDVAAELVWDTIQLALPPLRAVVDAELGAEPLDQGVRPDGRPASAPDEWLDRVYHAEGAAALARTYDAWAATYDADMLTIGYANPAVAVGLVARHAPSIDSRILDAGAGTGIVGELLSILGYRNLVGIDMSEGMLAKARARNVYSELRNRVLGEALDFDDGAFAAIVSFGVFTPGHAPASAFDELVRVTRPGGRLIFTISTAAWEGGDFSEKLRSLEQAGRIRAVASTDRYRPMPLSQAESTFTTRAYVYAVI